jgi:LmbE family N-acetylglucosaminyl deacetylase
MFLAPTFYRSRPFATFAKAFCAPSAVAFCAALLLAPAAPLAAQQPSNTDAPAAATLPPIQPTIAALPLPEDRGAAALAQDLRRLGTTGSVLMIVAHPDDEDGALLTYLSRGLGMRATLFTLTRGEGGQNAMGAIADDALGVLRTNELSAADDYYGARQLWGTEVDFGFSKTQEESFQQWTHQRVLYDAVLAVRRTRPQIIVATFLGGVSDGHGQHQVSGEIAQEVFKAAADPNVFPDQLKNGLTPWQPLAVYSRAPFARVTSRGIFDYATGKWAPARFHNYVTDTWIDGVPSTDVSVPVGTWDPVLGRTYIQIAREGWGMQKSQYGGASPALDAPATSSYHLWAVAPSAAAPASSTADTSSLYNNPKVAIDTSLAGLAHLVPGAAPAWLTENLRQIDADLAQFAAACPQQGGVAAAHRLAPIYKLTLDLYHRVQQSDLDPQSKSTLEFLLGVKVNQFQSTFKDLLGIDLIAFTTRDGGSDGIGSARGGTADESPSSVTPGQEFLVHVHSARASSELKPFTTAWFVSQTGTPWIPAQLVSSQQTAETSDAIFRLKVPANAQPTQPYFTRPNTEQPFYDVSDPTLRLDPFAPYPLAAFAKFTFDGLPILTGQVVQTLHRVPGVGGIYEPLIVTPAIGVSVQPEAHILPLDGSALPVRVTVHAVHSADGTVTLNLPSGWTSDPSQQSFHLKSAGDTEPLVFSVHPAAGIAPRAYAIQAIAHSGGTDYSTGWQSIGYPGLRPYNLYRPAQLRTRKIDVRLAPGLRIGYIMGTGDLVPDAIAAMGVTPHLLSDDELATADLAQWNVLVIGIRAYSVRPTLALIQPRLQQFVENGGTLVVQYQSSNFPAPLPLSMDGTPERVVDERAPVQLLAPSDPLLTTPNRITPADFDGWFEERGHSFLATWDPGYTALTETADPGQDPQRGGLLVTHPGKGTYIYVAYALYRQLPELVPGSYRILANLLSAGR